MKFHNLDLREIFSLVLVQQLVLEKNIEHISCEIVVEDMHLTETMICLSNMKERERERESACKSVRTSAECVIDDCHVWTLLKQGRESDRGY